MKIPKYGVCVCNYNRYHVRYIPHEFISSDRFVLISCIDDRSLGQSYIYFPNNYELYFTHIQNFVYGLIDNSKFWMVFETIADAVVYKLEQTV